MGSGAGAIGVGGGEALAEIRQGDAVLRASRTSERRNHFAKLDVHDCVVNRFSTRGTPEALRLRVGFNEGDALVAATGCLQIVEGDLVDREERGRCAELWRHIGDRCPIGEGDGCEPVAERFNVGTDNAMRAEALCHSQHKIGCGSSRRESPSESQPHDGWDGREEWFAEQHRLGLNAAHTEPEHAESRDHGGVRVGADAAVGEGEWCAVHLLDADNGGEVL